MANRLECPPTPMPAAQHPKPPLRCTPMPSLGSTVSTPAWPPHTPVGHGRQSPTQPLRAPSCGPGPGTLGEGGRHGPSSGGARCSPRPVQLSHRTWDPHREGPAGAGQVTARVTSAPGAETYTFCSGAANTGVVSHVIAAGTPGGPGSVLGGEPGEQEEQVLGSKASPRSGLGKGLGAPGSFPPSADPCGHLRAHRPHKAVPMRCGARCAPSEHTGPTSCTLPPHCASGETPGPDSQRG